MVCVPFNKLTATKPDSTGQVWRVFLGAEIEYLMYSENENKEYQGQ